MKYGFLRRAAVLTVSLLLLLAALPVFGASYPSEPSTVYVVDEANVIGSGTEVVLTAEGDALFALTGAQISVLTIDDGDAVDLEELAYEAFNDWGIGSAERNNGVLLVMNTKTEDYWVTAGYGIDDILNSYYLQTALDKYLEPYFAKKEYDAGAKAFYEALVEKLEKHYDVSIASWDGKTYLFDAGGSSTSRTHSDTSDLADFGRFLLILFLIILAYLFVVFLLAVISSRFGRWSHFFGGTYYGSSSGYSSSHHGSGSSSYHSSGSSSYHSSGSHSYHSSGGSHHSFGGGGSHGGGAGRH